MSPTPLLSGYTAPSRPAGTWVRGTGLFFLIVAVWLCSVCGSWLTHGVLSWGSGLLYVAYDTWLIAYVAFKARLSILDARRVSQVAPTEAAPTLSVLIAARNEVSVLTVTLAAVLPQLDARDEVLLIDDGSTDGTTELLQAAWHVPAALPAAGNSVCVAATTEPRLRVLRKPNSGKADSLNQALHVARGDVVITLDADTILDPGALAALRAAFAREPQLAAACGVLKPVCGKGFEARFFQWFQSFEYLRAFLSRAAWMRADALLLVSGAFAGFRRPMLERVGGFDSGTLVEDYELIHRLRRYSGDHGLGWTVRVLAEASATTDAPGTLKNFLRQRRRWFAGFLQTQYRYRDMTGNPRYGSVGRFMLPIKLVDTVQPFFGLTAFVLLVNFLVRGSPILKPVLAVIVVKILIDLSFQMWALRLYNGWVGRRSPARLWLLAVLASLAEPFSFQLMRHTGALLGWLALLTRRFDWAPQRPVALAPTSGSDASS